MSRPLHVDVSDLAKAQILAAEEWWRVNRAKAPNAVREDLERASSLIGVQPEIGARAKNISLPGVRRLRLARIRYDLYYVSWKGASSSKFWRSGTPVAGVTRHSDGARA